MPTPDLLLLAVDGAVRGFLTLLAGVIDRAAPDAVIVGFDDHTTSRRKAKFAEYKATRPVRDPVLDEAARTATAVLEAVRLPVCTRAGLEADDVLASAAATATAAGWRCLLATTDRDALALVTDTVHILRIGEGGAANAAEIGEAEVLAKYGITGGQYKEFAALRGDPSDNLPGPRGIGEKTAARLLAAFDALADVLADVDAGGAQVARVVGKACVGKLTDPGNRALLTRNLAVMTMLTSVPLPVRPSPTPDWRACCSRERPP